ncbi:MAG: class I SAM-dependent methyltransferase [Flavobacteriaceae bacterium]|nr:class I SAM-dependent methyltransferase [Bacteroidia bacterium]MBT8287797.1 class I SAM-dependent methyltransferase [Bacteroidia bacterium]NNF76219.1 class I SAM-dependent methyltransferase [Flavobacteriaceae bacterium]NNK72096.1 class I SAM-dependent methyltransferase [Flavobacteriaceae bacterium]
MSKQIVKSKIHYHNQLQLDYFAGDDKKTMVPVDSYYVNRHINSFIELSGIKRDQKLLEVGCGMGKFTFPLLKKGFNITGLDLSPYLLQKLLTHNDNRYSLELIASDILDIPAEYNDSFDHVIGFFTLHHFLNPDTYIKAMSRVLKPGGSIMFIEPNAYNPLYYVQIAITPRMTWKGDKGVALMNKKNFTRAANYAGLLTPEIKKYGFFPPFAVNNKIGRTVENGLEKLEIFRPLSAFLFVKMTKPL